MKRITSVFLFALCLVAPRVCVAQKLGQVECGQGDGSVYLYSSMLTLNIQTTLKCGQQIQILGRYDNFLQVRTDKGETGFVPVDAVRYVKSTAAARSTMGRQKDKRAAAASRNEKAAVASPSQARVAAPEIILPNQTPVHLQFGRAVSSADARVGEEVSFEVTQDVVVGGFTVIPKGATAIGAVTQAEPKRRMGRSGKLSVNVKYVQLKHNENVPLHSYQESKAADQKVGKVMPLMRGKDVTLAQGTEMTAYVSGDVRLKAAGLAAVRAKN